MTWLARGGGQTLHLVTLIKKGTLFTLKTLLLIIVSVIANRRRHRDIYSARGERSSGRCRLSLPVIAYSDCAFSH